MAESIRCYTKNLEIDTSKQTMNESTRTVQG